MIQNYNNIGLGGLAAIGNGQSGYSNAANIGMGSSESWQDGASWQNGYNSSWGEQASDAFSSAYGNSYSYGQSENTSQNSAWNNGENSSWNAVYGSEASAEDIIRAAEANAQQERFARMQMEYNTKEAQKARDYETYMSNTSYQRAIADLKAAGLNPILAAGNMGASTPVGAVASSGMANASKATTYANQSGASYGYTQGRSQGSSYGYSRNQSESNYRSNSESHSRGKSGSYGENSGGSYNKGGSKSSEANYGYSKSQHTNNLEKVISGIGDLFSGLSSAQKNYPGDDKGTGKGWDGYDNPTVMN